MKRYLFYFGHPAHYHMFKHVMKYLRSKNHKITVLIKKKDILEDLLREENIEYKNILPEGRSNSLAGIAYGVVKRDLRLLPYLLKNRHDLLIGSEPALAHVGKVLHIPSLIFSEDDYDVVKLFSKIIYPFCSYIISPEVCKAGKWKKKKIGYPGYQKLAYLHPSIFKPSLASIEKRGNDFQAPYFLIRLSGLTAYHDKGVDGFDDTMLKEVVRKLDQLGNVFISSEKKLPAFYKPYMLDLALKDIHHILANAQLFISDSQSMSVEASLLGTPSLRLSDLAGRISILEELEHKYNLTFGFKPDEKQALLSKLNELLKLDELKRMWQQRRSNMLNDKINVHDFYCWLFEKYPYSIKKLQSEPDFTKTFK